MRALKKSGPLSEKSQPLSDKSHVSFFRKSREIFQKVAAFFQKVNEFFQSGIKHSIFFSQIAKDLCKKTTKSLLVSCEIHNFASYCDIESR